MNLLERLFDKRSSAETAKQRLKLVLNHDRAEIPPGVLALIRDDIIAVISRRVNIDRDNVVVNVTHADWKSKLLVDIPLLTRASSIAGDATAGGGTRSSSQQLHCADDRFTARE